MTSAVHRILAAAALAAVLAVMAAPSSSQEGSDFSPGDIFVGVSGIKGHPGEYVRLDSSGRFQEILTDDTQGDGAFTAGCAIDPTSGHLWVTSFFANTVSEFDEVHGAQGHEILRVIDTDGLNGMGASESVGFDPAGNLYVGNVDGSNPLLKFDLSAVPPSSTSFFPPITGRGVDWFDIVTETPFDRWEADGTSRVIRMPPGQPHGLQPGDQVSIAGSDPAVNGTHTVSLVRGLSFGFIASVSISPPAEGSAGAFNPGVWAPGTVFYTSEDTTSGRSTSTRWLRTSSRRWRAWAAFFAPSRSGCSRPATVLAASSLSVRTSPSIKMGKLGRRR